MKTSDRLDEWPSTPIHHPDHNSDDLSEYLKRADIQKVTPTHKPSAKPSGDKDGRTGYEKFLSTLQNFHRRTRPPSYTVKTEEAMQSLSSQIHEIKSQQIFIDKPKQKRRLLRTPDLFQQSRPIKHERRISHVQLEFGNTSKFTNTEPPAKELGQVEIQISHKAARKSTQKFPSHLISNIYSLGHPVEDYEETRSRKARYRANLYRHLHKTGSKKGSRAAVERLLTQMHQPKSQATKQAAQERLIKGNSFLPTKARLALTSHNISRTCLA